MTFYLPPRADDARAEAFYLSFPILVMVCYWRWI